MIKSCLVCGLLVLLLTASPARAQATATIRGSVHDALGGVVVGATVSLRQASSGLVQVVVSAADGSFELANVPTGVVDVVVESPGFESVSHRVEVLTPIPVALAVRLQVATLTDEVHVTPMLSAVDSTTGGTRHAVSTTRLERVPMAVTSRGLEAILVAFPGFSQNANGAIHPRGAHNQMTYVLDGLAISDQLTGAFANALDTAVVQTAEVITGNVPAEFGGKVSAVALLNSRSGAGTGRRLAGSAALTAGGFGTAHATTQVGGEVGRVAYFGSITGLDTNRFLDQVSLDNVHNAGQFLRGFSRVDVRLEGGRTWRVNLIGGRSRFDLAHLRSQERAGQDQRQALGDVSVWTTYLAPLGVSSTLEATLGVRRTTGVLRGSAGDTPVTASQDRGVSTFSSAMRYAAARGAHLIRFGGDVQHIPVREAFSMAITSPTFNEPGNRGFNPALVTHDLTRGGSPFSFAATDTGVHASAFIQTTIRRGGASWTLGLRHDEYHFLAHARQLQPRLGVAYRVPGRDIVFRASYNRNLHTPPTENLLLSSSEQASRLAPDSVRLALGGAHRVIQSERQDVVEAGVQFSLGGVVTLDAVTYRKRSRDQQDNNNFFDTGIIFPTTLQGIRVSGAEARLSFQPRRGLSGALSATTSRAISTPPFTGGLFLGQDAVDLLSAGPFPIDHDQRLSLHGTVTWDTAGPWWFGASVRHDSGLVANPSDPAVVAADPDFADLLPFVDLEASPARVRPRTIVDATGGLDIAGSSGGTRQWALQLQVTNLFNVTALYNFQSVFVGTRLVQPRTWSAKIVRHF